MANEIIYFITGKILRPRLAPEPRKKRFLSERVVFFNGLCE
jgi:hypothetical protein